MSSSTLSLWAVPSPPDTSQKKPARNSSTSVQRHTRLGHESTPALSLVKDVVSPVVRLEAPLDFVSSAFAPHSLSSIRSPQQHNHNSGVCPACRALEIEAMQDFTELPFYEAFPLWFEAHKPTISERSIYDYKQYGAALTAFFGVLQLKNIGNGQIKGYQRWRNKDYAHESKQPFVKYQHAARSVRIRSEINCVLKPVLREAGRWAEIEEKKFKHLPVPREGSGTPLTLDEQDAVLEVGFSNKKWMLAAHCQRVMYRTGTLFGELRKMRRKHVDLKHGSITILEGAKNYQRERTVRLVPSALESTTWIVARFEKMGGLSADQFILPHRKKGLYFPMGSTYRSWCAIIDAAIAKYSDNLELVYKLQHTRQCDGRTSAACLMLQNEKLSLPVIEKALGWTPNTHMRKRYHKAAQNIQYEALMTLEKSS
jgi:integrase